MQIACVVLILAALVMIIGLADAKSENERSFHTEALLPAAR